MSNPGPESLLDDELTLKIRLKVLNGAKYKQIQDELLISSNTWDTWVYKDYKDFRKNLKAWKFERLVNKSEYLSEEILDMPHSGDKGVETDVLRIKQKEAEFIRETAGKNDGYSKRTELGGIDGKDLQITVVNYADRTGSD